MRNDRRQSPRKLASETIHAQDVNTGHNLGLVVNLNNEGIMLLAPTPIETNLIFQLKLKLHTPHQGYGFLHIGVESMWCSNTNEPDHYWAGFRIIDISLTTIELIESLIDSWETDKTRH